MPNAVVLFTRVLRVHDHPALATAARRADAVLPLFVVDPEIVEGPFGAANRLGFLREALQELRAELRRRGGDLVLRSGDVARETLELARRHGADTIHVSHDVSRFAQRRQAELERLAAEAGVSVVSHPGIGVIEPGRLTPSGGKGDHFKVFTPYHRAWAAADRRPLAGAPTALRVPDGLDVGPDPERLLPDRLLRGGSPRRPTGGEAAGRQLLQRWLAGPIAGYADNHDALAADRTSRLSPYLHFGCLSALELERRAPEGEGPAAFVRQLCWRDFYHQVTAAFPDIARRDYRTRHDRWADDDDSVRAWKEGRTGYPIVDAGMRQLLAEGWMHNRARMITASFLVKDLGIDWRVGAEHFTDWLCDGDIAQNSANWQWTAGTGNDTRPNRVFNPLRQAERFDPAGDYVRRYVPELAELHGPEVHQPWRLPADRRPSAYPERIVDHDAAAAAFKARRTGQLQLEV